MRTASLFMVCLTLRFLNSVLTSTFFSPDEYWQSLEPAHYLVFGYIKQLNKTKQNKTKQNKTKQNKTKQNKTKQNKTEMDI